MTSKLLEKHSDISDFVAYFFERDVLLVGEEGKAVALHLFFAVLVAYEHNGAKDGSSGGEFF